MSLFYFLDVALRDSRHSSPQADGTVASQAKTEQIVAAVDPPSTLCFNRPLANATLLMLARNSDLAGAISSVSQMEDKFNKHCNYPWVFLNEEPFTEEFKRCVIACGAHSS